MWRLAYRQLTLDPARSMLTAVSIGAAIAVILVLRGFEQGLYLQLESAVLQRGAQLFVAQAGVKSFVATRSSLPQLSRADVEAVPGVASAHPITAMPVIYGPEDNRVPIYLLVYDTLGGPGVVDAGRPVRGGRDAVIDLGLSRRYGLEPGDTLTISDFEFRVAGITSGQSALFMPFVFISYDGMIDFFLESEIAPDLSTFPLLSYLLVELEPDAQASAVARQIEDRVPQVDVLTPDQLARNDVALGHELFGPILGALIAVAYVVGILVVGLIVYADVSQRRRSFGVMKALGFRVSRVFAGVSAQTFLLLVLAFPSGALLAVVTAATIEWFAPVYRVYVLEPTGLAQTAAGVVVMALLGAILPVRLIARISPLVAFRSE